MSIYIIPLFILITIIFSIKNKNNAYESFVNGANDAIKLLPKMYVIMLLMIFATNILLASGLIDLIKLSLFIPKELFLQFLLRPVSASAATSVMLDIYNKYGVDSIYAIISSVLDGSSDTTIYIITLYFGSIGIKDYRYALVSGLIADTIGFIVTVLLFMII